MPAELGDLKKLEKIIMTQCIVFAKIIMAKGQRKKMKDAKFNIPVQCDVLPHAPDRSGIILLQLNRN